MKPALTTETEPILSVKDVDLDTIIANRRLQYGDYYASPDAWEDQVFYFLLTDRFSDGEEDDVLAIDGESRSIGERPRFVSDKDADNAVKNEKQSAKWREAGNTFTGGNLRGLTQKLGYLSRLGITTVWLSPVLKQCPRVINDYHGYGTQNFYEIDPHFGTREDLSDFVRTAHERGIRVILDIILNHCGDVFAYDGDENRPWTGEQYPVKAFRDRDGSPTIPFGKVDRRKHRDTDGAVWPQELQDPECFTRKGYMVNWEYWPEYEEGDFFSLKDLNLGRYERDVFVASTALKTLTEVYKYWIAYADLDGFRIDTVKHMGPGPTSWFAAEIKKFTHEIGKNNFYLIGEVAGSREHMHWMVRETGLDAALGIYETAEKMRGVIRGEISPCAYFGMFMNTKREQETNNDANWWRNRLITFFDDHDQVGRPVKGRFASEWRDDKKKREAGVLRALAFNVTTLGVPCIYYGTEQGFDGHAVDENGDVRYVRETMHGREFGAFGSRDRHFFNESNRLYKELAKILALRQTHPALRRGRQYLRPISLDGEQFFEPERLGDPYRGVIAWSRLLDTDEFICAINTDEENAQSAWITLDPARHAPESAPLKYVYSTNIAQVDEETDAPQEKNGTAVRITVPAGGFVIFR